MRPIQILSHLNNNPTSQEVAQTQHDTDLYIQSLLNTAQHTSIESALKTFYEQHENGEIEIATAVIRKALRNLRPKSTQDIQAMLAGTPAFQRSMFQETLQLARAVPDGHPAFAWLDQMAAYEPRCAIDAICAGDWMRVWLRNSRMGLQDDMQYKPLTESLSPALAERVKSCWELAIDDYTPPHKDEDLDAHATTVIGLGAVWMRMHAEGDPRMNATRAQKLKTGLAVYQEKYQRSSAVFDAATLQTQLNQFILTNIANTTRVQGNSPDDGPRIKPKI